MAKKDYMPVREDELLAWFNNFSTKLPGYQLTFGLTAMEVSEFQAEALVIEGALMAVELARTEAREWVQFKNIEFYGPLGSMMPAVPSTPTPVSISPRAPGILQRTRALVQRIKAHPNYTPAVGADLNIIGPEAAPPTEIKPTGTATPLANFAGALCAGLLTPHLAPTEGLLCHTIRSGDARGDLRSTIRRGRETRAERAFVKGGFDGVDIESQRGAETTWTYLAFDSSSPYIDNRPPPPANPNSAASACATATTTCKSACFRIR
ncbi:MAG: hypothetical protein WD468_07430 [Pirellulales bacterium]